eukprot:363747-Chlamydomonas_euryale.AAC.4
MDGGWMARRRGKGGDERQGQHLSWYQPIPAPSHQPAPGSRPRRRHIVPAYSPSPLCWWPPSAAQAGRRRALCVGPPIWAAGV